MLHIIPFTSLAYAMIDLSSESLAPAGRSTVRNAPRCAISHSTVFLHLLSPRYCTLPGTRVSRSPPSARPCRGPSTYDAGMNATGSIPRSLQTSDSIASTTPRDRGSLVRQPSLAKREALYVHARLAPSRTTTEHRAFEASALRGRAAAAAASASEGDASSPPPRARCAASDDAAAERGAMPRRFAAATGMGRGDCGDACRDDPAEPATACQRASMESGGGRLVESE